LSIEFYSRHVRLVEDVAVLVVFGPAKALLPSGLRQSVRSLNIPVISALQDRVQSSRVHRKQLRQLRSPAHFGPLFERPP
jgi:hypothetical protein